MTSLTVPQPKDIGFSVYKGLRAAYDSKGTKLVRITWNGTCPSGATKVSPGGVKNLHRPENSGYSYYPFLFLCANQDSIRAIKGSPDPFLKALGEAIDSSTPFTRESDDKSTATGVRLLFEGGLSLDGNHHITLGGYKEQALNRRKASESAKATKTTLIDFETLVNLKKVTLCEMQVCSPPTAMKSIRESVAREGYAVVFGKSSMRVVKVSELKTTAKAVKIDGLGTIYVSSDVQAIANAAKSLREEGLIDSEEKFREQVSKLFLSSSRGRSCSPARAHARSNSPCGSPVKARRSASPSPR